MGVYVDKYVGYMIDISEEIFKLRKENIEAFDELLDGIFYNEIAMLDKYKDAGFKCRYGDDTASKEDLELVYDGMNGDYAYIILIDTVDRYSNDESDIPELIKLALMKTPIPEEVTEKLSKAYNVLFDQKLDKPIYLQMLNHWH